eukprot:gene9039-1136_t
MELLQSLNKMNPPSHRHQSIVYKQSGKYNSKSKYQKRKEYSSFNLSESQKLKTVAKNNQQIHSSENQKWVVISDEKNKLAHEIQRLAQIQMAASLIGIQAEIPKIGK